MTWYRKTRNYFSEAAQFARESRMKFGAPRGAMAVRWINQPKVVLGGALGRLYHSVGIPFELTPLIALPFIGLGAYFLFVGPLWLGVLCNFVAVICDNADGIATGYSINHLPPTERPTRKVRLRRFLDTYVVDSIARLALYGVFVALLHQLQLVAPAALAALLAVEVTILFLSTAAEGQSRESEFFHEYVLRDEAKPAYGRMYSLRVVIGHMSGYYIFCFFPLLSYLWPLDEFGVTYFGALLLARLGTLGYRLSARSARAVA